MSILHTFARWFYKVTAEGAGTHTHVCPSGGCHYVWECSVWDGSCGNDLCQSCELDRRDQWIKKAMAAVRT